MARRTSEQMISDAERIASSKAIQMITAARAGEFNEDHGRELLRAIRNLANRVAWNQRKRVLKTSRPRPGLTP